MTPFCTVQVFSYSLTIDCTILGLCSRRCLTTRATSTSSAPFSAMSRRMKETASSVPVRPTPALQCITIGLSGSSMLSRLSPLGFFGAAIPFSEMQRSACMCWKGKKSIGALFSHIFLSLTYRAASLASLAPRGPARRCGGTGG